MSPSDEGAAPDHEADRIRREAAEWLAKTIDQPLNAADQRAFDAWLDRDPRHAEAFGRIERLWEGSGDLSGLKEPKDDAPKVSRRDIGKAVVLVAAGAVAWRYLSDHPLADYRTGVGETRAVDAPDGSRIQLAPDTRLSLSYGNDVRKVVLHQGEAFFRVAPEIRSFTVAAGHGETTALGTAFSVRYRDGVAHVVVTEHAVQVSTGASKALVRSGLGVRYDDAVGPVESIDAEEALAWREGRLVFHGRPLGEVVETLNLWRRGRIVVVGSALAQRPVTLFVDIDQVDVIGEQLARVLPVRLVQITPLLMLILPA